MTKSAGCNSVETQQAHRLIRDFVSIHVQQKEGTLVWAALCEKTYFLHTSKNKGTDHLRDDSAPNKRPCLSTSSPLLSYSGISSLQPSSVAAQPGLCRMETPKMGFLMIGFNFDDGKTVKNQTNINHQQKEKNQMYAF